MDQPGEPVGIRTAQSILRKATQSSLSHFHVAGMEKLNYQQNYPTIADAMDSRYSNTNTSVTFSVKEQYIPPSEFIVQGGVFLRRRVSKFIVEGESNVSDPAQPLKERWLTKILGRINRHLVGKKLSWFVTMIRSNMTELPEYENIWYESSNQEMFPHTILRLYIDYTKLVQFDLTLIDIAETCFYDTPWHASPDWMGMIDLDIIKNYMNLVLSKIDTVLCGNPSISAVHADIDIFAPICEEEDVNRHNHIIKVVTDGSDIVSVSQLPNVEKHTIRSNHVLDVQKNLGIEAAASALREIIGSDVISDFMTRTGIVLPFYNSSPEVFKKGALTAMAFERPRTHIQKFLRFSSWDKHPSVYADIMVGNNPEQDFSILSSHTCS